MKKLIVSVVFFASLLSTTFYYGCKKEDDLNPEEWAPQNFWVEDIGIFEKELTWDYYGPGSLDGFKIDRKAGDEDWEVPYQTFRKETRTWIDTNIVPVPPVFIFYRIYAFKGNQRSDTEEISTITKIIPAPVNFTIISETITQNKLEWTYNNELLDGFRIERSYEDGNWQIIATTISLNYTDTSFNLNTNVKYRICVFKDTYCSEYVNNEIYAVFPEPKNTRIYANSFYSATLSWDYNHSGHSKFKIDRKVNEGEWIKEFAVISGSLTSFTDENVDLEINDYTYAVYAYTKGFESEKTNESINYACGAAILTDPRDGTEYETVQIGHQCWMKENLAYLPNVSPPSNGSETSDYYYVYGYGGSNVSDAKATSNYQTYGVLYNWPASLNACPPGWHLPEGDEWIILTDYIGGSNVAGGKIKEIGIVHWKNPNIGATNSSGFTALPGGLRYLGYFHQIGYRGHWWTSTDMGTLSLKRELIYNKIKAGSGNSPKNSGLSVRCIRDN